MGTCTRREEVPVLVKLTFHPSQKETTCTNKIILDPSTLVRTGCFLASDLLLKTGVP